MQMQAQPGSLPQYSRPSRNLGGWGTHLLVPYWARYLFSAITVAVGLCTTATAQDAESVTTTVFDMEEDAYAAQITAVEGVTAADCAVRDSVLPARGQHSLAIEIGATKPGASAVVELRGRDEILFDHAQRVAAYAWLASGDGILCLRLRDATGRVFESKQQFVNQHKRWQRIAVELKVGEWFPVAGADPASAASKPAEIKPPFALIGFRSIAPDVGRQTLFVDDLEVEHEASGADLVRGVFHFNQPIQLYAVGANIGAALTIENLHRKQTLNVSVTIAWRRADGAEIKSQRTDLNLPPSTAEYRSRQNVDASIKLDEPGLYRLVARIQTPRWPQPRIVETGLAVMQSNRGLARGRSTLFAVRSNLLEDPRADQDLELQLADELGAELFAIVTPWARLEPRPGTYDFTALDPLVGALVKRSIFPMISLTEALPGENQTGAALTKPRQALLDALVAHFGAKVRYFELAPATGPTTTEALNAVQEALAAHIQNPVVIGPRVAIHTQAKPSDLPTNPIAAQIGGSAGGALRILKALGASGARGWKPGDWWIFTPAAENGVGDLDDTLDLIQFYCEAASAGIAGLVCVDLRDQTNDPHHPERMHGLVRRDFSPKSMALGFAAAAAILNGCTSAGRLPNAPPAYDTYAFRSPTRQLIALIPQPGANRNALVGIAQTGEGQLHAFTAEKRAVPLFEGSPAVLLPAARPVIAELTLAKLTTDFGLAFAPAWMTVPAEVACGASGSFDIELTPPMPLRKSYLEVLVPRDCGLKSSISNRQLKGEAGQPIKLPCELTRDPAYRDAPATLTLNVSLEGRTFPLPIAVNPVLRLANGPSQLDDAHRLGTLRPALLDTTPNANAPAPVAGPGVFAGRNADILEILVELPATLTAGGRAVLNIREPAGGMDLQWTIRNVLAQPTVESSESTDSGGVSAARENGAKATLLRIRIPQRSLAAGSAAPKSIRISLRIEDPAQLGSASEWRFGESGNATGALGECILELNAGI